MTSEKDTAETIDLTYNAWMLLQLARTPGTLQCMDAAAARQGPVVFVATMIFF